MKERWRQIEKKNLKCIFFSTNKDLFRFIWIWHHIIVVSECVKVLNFNSMAIKYI